MELEHSRASPGRQAASGWPRLCGAYLTPSFPPLWREPLYAAAGAGEAKCARTSLALHVSAEPGVPATRAGMTVSYMGRASRPPSRRKEPALYLTARRSPVWTGCSRTGLRPAAPRRPGGPSLTNLSRPARLAFGGWRGQRPHGQCKCNSVCQEIISSLLRLSSFLLRFRSGPIRSSYSKSSEKDSSQLPSVPR